MKATPLSGAEPLTFWGLGQPGHADFTRRCAVRARGSPRFEPAHRPAKSFGMESLSSVEAFDQLASASRINIAAAMLLLTLLQQQQRQRWGSNINVNIGMLMLLLTYQH